MKYLLAALFFLHVFSCPAQQPTLDYFIQQAKTNSPVLKDLQNQVLSIRIDSQILRATQRPAVAFISNDLYAPVIHGWGYDEIITNLAAVSGQVQASRNFISRGNLAAQLRTIALQSQSLLDTIRLSQQDLVRTITEQYITAYGDQLVMDFNLDLFEVMKKEEVILKKLTEASVYKQTDYLSFYVTMQQQELLYLQAQIQYNTDFLTLNYLSGVVDTSIQRVERPQLTDSLKTDFYTSVFYQRFTTDSLRLLNERQVINYSYRPRIGAYVDGGYNSNLQVMPYRNFGASAGVSVSIPIYDGRQKQLRYAQLDIRERTRQTNRDFYVNQYRQQVAQLRQQLRATDLLVQRINQQIVYAKTLITANGKLLETGDITMKDYVTAITNYLNAQNLLTQNTVSRLKILNQLNYWNLTR